MTTGSINVRKYTDFDRDGLSRMLEAHMRIDTTWPPQYARQEGDVVDWLATRSKLGRWIALDNTGVVGHLSADEVESGEKADVWQLELGCVRERLAEVGRLLVLPEARRSGVSGSLTRRGVRDIVERGYVPVASALEDSTASISMMTNLGWRVLGTVRGRRSGQPILLLVPPELLIDSALSRPDVLQ